MSATVFYWIGIGATSLVCSAVIMFVGFYLFAKLIHQRFHWIPFRKTERRLSLASWHQTRTMQMGNQDPSPDVFTFDDWPIAHRPFYLSYTFGDRRFFLMLGVMESVRHTVGKGKHPNKDQS